MYRKKHSKYWVHYCPQFQASAGDLGRDSSCGSGRDYCRRKDTREDTNWPTLWGGGVPDEAHSVLNCLLILTGS